jgi:hypothetical protein
MSAYGFNFYPLILGYLKKCLKTASLNRLLIMPIFLKAAGVFKMSSYWFKGF